MVVGDRFGRSAAPWLTAAALEIASEAGFSPAANDPFAGGHVLDRHGSPHQGVHALQIEVDRATYLTPAGATSAGFDLVYAIIEALTVLLGRLLIDHRLASAA